MRCRIVAFAALLCASAGAKEPEGVPASPRVVATQEPRLSLSLTNRTGLVRAPFVTAAFPEVSGFASVLTPAAALRLSSAGWLSAKLPLSYVRLDFPAGAQVGEVALGNLELAFERAFQFERGPQIGFLAGFLAPTAKQGPARSLLANRALALAGALDGHKDLRLFTPGVMGVRLGANLEHSFGRFWLRADLGVPVLLRLSRASLPAEAETHVAGIAPVLSLRAAWWIKPWFAPALGASLVTDAVRVQEPYRRAERNQRLQPVLEPAVQFRLGRRLLLALDASIPIAGALGGEAWSVAPSARFDF